MICEPFILNFQKTKAPPVKSFLLAKVQIKIEIGTLMLIVKDDGI